MIHYGFFFPFATLNHAACVPPFGPTSGVCRPEPELPCIPYPSPLPLLPGEDRIKSCIYAYGQASRVPVIGVARLQDLTLFPHGNVLSFYLQEILIGEFRHGEQLRSRVYHPGLSDETSKDRRYRSCPFSRARGGRIVSSRVAERHRRTSSKARSLQPEFPILADRVPSWQGEGPPRR